jgi:hypothetical protein
LLELGRPIQAQLRAKESIKFGPSTIEAHQQRSSITRPSINWDCRSSSLSRLTIDRGLDSSVRHDRHKKPSLTQLTRFCQWLVGSALKIRSLNYLFCSTIPEYDNNARSALQYSDIANVPSTPQFEKCRHCNLVTRVIWPY